jgi:hypothetical protein
MIGNTWAMKADVACFIGAWVSAVYHLIRMRRSLRPDPPGRPLPYSNPTNAIFYPADLTPRGRRYRERALFSILLVFLFFWLGIVLAAVT